MRQLGENRWQPELQPQAKSANWQPFFAVKFSQRPFAAFCCCLIFWNFIFEHSLVAWAEPPTLPQPAVWAADWLYRNRLSTGSFCYGWLPAFDRPLPGTHPLRQAGAAAVLAAAGQYGARPEWSEAARQVLTTSFAIEPVALADPERWRAQLATRFPAHEYNPVGLAALLLWGLCELPAPTPIEAAAAQHLRSFLLERQRPDGSMDVSAAWQGNFTERPTERWFYPGEAFFALARSHARWPDPKLEAVIQRGFAHYQPSWQDEPTALSIPWQTAAWTTAHTYWPNPDAVAATFLMNDWLVGLQYLPKAAESADFQGQPVVPTEWQGGFADFEDGFRIEREPTIATACYLESLAYAYQLAVKQQDEVRQRRYRQALQLGLAFLARLQFTSANSGHFQPELAHRLHGAFAASGTDGTTRIDFNQHAINAYLQMSVTSATIWESATTSIDTPAH